MEQYENIQIARRVSRLIEETRSEAFPLITYMYIIAMLAGVVTAIGMFINA